RKTEPFDLRDRCLPFAARSQRAVVTRRLGARLGRIRLPLPAPVQRSTNTTCERTLEEAVHQLRVIAARRLCRGRSRVPAVCQLRAANRLMGRGAKKPEYRWIKR